MGIALGGCHYINRRYMFYNCGDLSSYVMAGGFLRYVPQTDQVVVNEIIIVCTDFTIKLWKQCVFEILGQKFFSSNVTVVYLMKDKENKKFRKQKRHSNTKTKCIASNYHWSVLPSLSPLQHKYHSTRAKIQINNSSDLLTFSVVANRTVSDALVV